MRGTTKVKIAGKESTADEASGKKKKDGSKKKDDSQGGLSKEDAKAIDDAVQDSDEADEFLNGMSDERADKIGDDGWDEINGLLDDMRDEEQGEAEEGSADSSKERLKDILTKAMGDASGKKKVSPKNAKKMVKNVVNLRKELEQSQKNMDKMKARRDWKSDDNEEHYAIVDDLEKAEKEAEKAGVELPKKEKPYWMPDEEPSKTKPRYGPVSYTHLTLPTKA